MDTGGLVKLFFRLIADEWHGHASESLWAEPVLGSDAYGLYRLRNSPFFTRGVSVLDVVRAVPSDYFADGREEAVELLDSSGHSTYMVICQTDLERFKQRWELLQALGCTYESTEHWTALFRRCAASDGCRASGRGARSGGA